MMLMGIVSRIIGVAFMCGGGYMLFLWACAPPALTGIAPCGHFACACPEDVICRGVRFCGLGLVAWRPPRHTNTGISD